MLKILSAAVFPAAVAVPASPRVHTGSGDAQALRVCGASCPAGFHRGPCGRRCWPN